jgi:hypothetical protein
MVEGFVQAIIAAETNYIRFEKFCADVMTKEEGVTFVPTSVTYDQGRDARALGSSRGTHRAIICATLNQNIDDKIRQDLRTAAKTTAPDRLIYCCSQPLTERRIDQLTALIRKELNSKCHVQIFGALQLAALAEKSPEIFGAYYKAEVDVIEAKLLSFQAGGERSETKGLRLALIAFGSQDAATLRRAMSTRAVLDVLRQYPDGASEADIASKLSEDLRLPKTLNGEYIRTILQQIAERGMADVEHGTFRITPAGKTEAESVPPEAARVAVWSRSLKLWSAPWVRTALKSTSCLRNFLRNRLPFWSASPAGVLCTKRFEDVEWAPAKTFGSPARRLRWIRWPG